MLPQVLLIGQSIPDTAKFYAGAKACLNRSITGPIDNAHADPETVKSFMVAVAEMLAPGQNYRKVIRNPGSVLKHTFFQFMVLAEVDHCSEFAQHTNLSIAGTGAKRGTFFHLISGTLEQWRTAIINCSSEIVDTEFRLIMNKCMVEFEQVGLSQLWSDYTKQPMPDETIKLLEHK